MIALALGGAAQINMKIILSEPQKETLLVSTLTQTSHIRFQMLFFLQTKRM